MKITSAEGTVLHAVLSVAFASIIASGDSFLQLYYQHGLDVVQTAIVFAPTFLASMGVMRVAMWHALKSNAALPQAEQDLGQQALTEVRSLWAAVQPLFTHTHNAPSQQAQQPIVSRAITTPASRTPQPILLPQSAPPVPAARFGDTTPNLPITTPPTL